MDDKLEVDVTCMSLANNLVLVQREMEFSIRSDFQ